MDAERAVLGALLLDRDGFRKIGDLLRDAAFYSDAHKIIFRAMRNLHEQGTPLDMISVNEELRRMGKLTEIGGALALSNISMATPTAANIEHHARLVWEKGKRRELLIACAEILHHAGEEIDNIFEDLEMARSKVEGLLSSDEFPQRGQDEIRDRTQILTEIWEKIIDGDDGHIIPTGYAKLDARLGDHRYRRAARIREDRPRPVDRDEHRRSGSLRDLRTEEGRDLRARDGAETDLESSDCPDRPDRLLPVRSPGESMDAG
jgi:replicative DNA helicase